MKYKSQQYAVALYEALVGKDAEKGRVALDNFFIILKKNGDLGLLKKVVGLFEKYARKKEGVFAGELILAHPISANDKSALIEKVTSFISEERGVAVNQLLLEEKQDSDLIGGCRVRVGDILIDMSVSGALEKIHSDLQLPMK